MVGIIDRRTLSHQENNRRMPIILGHTVKGIVRDRFRHVSRMLGVPSSVEEQMFGTEARQGTVFFSPWRMEPELRNQIRPFSSFLFETKTGNQLVRARRVAKHDHLFTYEVVKESLCWLGEVSGHIGQEEPFVCGVPRSLVVLLWALKSVSRVGGRRRSGSGACTVIIRRLTVQGRTYDEKQVTDLLAASIEQMAGGK
nr:RAMP superfamily CRISPR-associated protein [Geobacillus zalihae]